MRFNFKLIKEIDYGIVFSVIAICLAGMISIRSATGNNRLFMTQMLWLVMACVVGMIVLSIDYTNIGSYYKILYIFSIFLLVLVLLIGKVRNNAKSWLGIGPIGGQPSELAKIFLIITLAKLMEDMDNINTFKNFSKLMIYSLIPMILIQLQPDTGTNLIFVVTIFSMLFIAGLNSKVVWTIVGGLTTVVGALYIIIAENFDKYLTFLKPYQWDRIRVFFEPETDVLGSGLNAYMAKLAIGSGMFFGNGYGGTDLTRGKFIPESHTDFIFSVFAEQWGFLGCTVLLLLYLNLIIRGIKIAKSTKDKFGFYLIIGILSMLVFQVFQNIGMDIGLLPITGIPLPFMSYGGSSLLTNVVSVALILNVGIRRQKINFSRG